MRLTQTLIAGALLAAPAVSFGARPEQQKLTLDWQQRNNGNRTSEEARNFTGQDFQPGNTQMLPGQGRTITTEPAGAVPRRSAVTGRIVASDDHQLILQNGVRTEAFDVHRLAFSRSLKPGEQVTIQMKGDGQSPDKVYLVGASATLGPIAAEPAPEQ